jgi:hypothetical protein
MASSGAKREVAIGTGKLRVPRGRPDQGSGSESIRAAKIALAGTVLAALITAIAAVLVPLLQNKTPHAAALPPATASGSDVPPGSSSRSPPSDGPSVSVSAGEAQVEFASPREDTPISPGDDVKVSGTVTGLGVTSLWILAWHQDGESFFLIPGPAGDVSPATTKDGPWSVIDYRVGNKGDKGSAIVYTSVQADVECTKKLSSMNDYTSFRQSELPQGCAILPSRRGVRVK